MYRTIKALNNNGVLALDEVTKKEVVLMGNGVGFGKKPTERFEKPEGVKVYQIQSTRISSSKRESSIPAIQKVNSIDPKYLEIAGKIMELAEQRFSKVHQDGLIPLADHIAYAVKRMMDGTELLNPFTPDIRALYEEEYQVAREGRAIIEKQTGFAISDDEVGYITLHIHASVGAEDISQTMKLAVLVGRCIPLIEERLGIVIDKESLAHNRLRSHIRYMIARNEKGEPINLDMEDYVRATYPDSYGIAEEVCRMLERELSCSFARQEIGCLGLHIERVRQD